MLICKGPGNSPRWSFVNPPMDPEGEIQGNQYRSDFIGGEIEVQRRSDPGTNGLLRDALDTQKSI